MAYQGSRDESSTIQNILGPLGAIIFLLSSVVHVNAEDFSVYVGVKNVYSHYRIKSSDRPRLGLFISGVAADQDSPNFVFCDGNTARVKLEYIEPVKETCGSDGDTFAALQRIISSGQAQVLSFDGEYIGRLESINVEAREGSLILNIIGEDTPFWNEYMDDDIEAGLSEDGSVVLYKREAEG